MGMQQLLEEKPPVKSDMVEGKPKKKRKNYNTYSLGANATLIIKGRRISNGIDVRTKQSLINANLLAKGR